MIDRFYKSKSSRIACAVGVLSLLAFIAFILHKNVQTLSPPLNVTTALAHQPQEIPPEPLPVTGIVGEVRFQSDGRGRGRQSLPAEDERALHPPTVERPFTLIGEEIAQELSITIVDKITNGVDFMQSAPVDQEGAYALFDLAAGHYVVILGNRSDHVTVGTDSFVVNLREGRVVQKNFIIADEPGEGENQRRGPSAQTQLEEALLESILFIRPSSESLPDIANVESTQSGLLTNDAVESETLQSPTLVDSQILEGQ